MHDVCIIYSRNDGHIPPALERIISPTWTVWWDKEVTGDFRQAIETAIKAAKCVIVVWSNSSRESKVVIDEASFATRHNVPLLPIFIEESATAPLGFGSIDSINLFNWTGRESHPALPTLIQKLRLVAPPAETRPSLLTVGEKSIRSPTFFFSVSSHETRLNPLECIKALTIFGAEAMLVSAYDAANASSPSKFNSSLTRARSANSIVLLDSGNYEASRKGDHSWSYSKLHKILKSTPHDFAFCFDEMAPKGKPDSLVRTIVAAVERESRHTSRPVLPIVHAPKGKDGQYQLEVLPYILRKVSDILHPTIIGVPERELGAGLIAKAQTLAKIRAELAKAGRYQPLHILGTGNPLSMAVLSAVGGDCFDGLEWCRVIADAENNTLYHFEQYDFFAYQTRLAQSPIVRTAADSKELNYVGRALFHNMDYFTNFVTELRSATSGDRMIRFLSERLPTGSMRQLEAALPEVF